MEATKTKMIRIKMSNKALEKIIGGGNDVLGDCDHNWVFTGNERESWWFFFWTKHEKEYYCTNCHCTDWKYSD